MPTYYCYDCNHNVSTPNYCITCGSCIGCYCVCHPETHVNKFKMKPKFHIGKDNKLNASNRFVAVEIEVAGVKCKAKEVEKVVKKWNGSIVRDGSIPITGFEITTAPAAGDLFVKQINEICDKLAEAKAWVNNQCGLHVHIDARDFNFYDIRRLIKVYAEIEPALFLMVPKNRRTSHFCKKCAQNYLIALGDDSYENVKRDIIVSTYNDTNSTSRRKHKYDDARYNALNLHSWFYRGTIEFRLFEGNTDTDEIINLGTLWAAIVDYALMTEEKAIIINGLCSNSQSYDNLIEIVKDNNRLKKYITTRYNKYKAEKK